MQRVTFDRPWHLYDAPRSREVERAAAAGLPPHALMQRAGLAVAQLALAIAPHARRIWVACGPGNNGGDGFEAALHLHRWGKEVSVTWSGDEAKAPADARASLRSARDAGVKFVAAPPVPFDLAIDAMLGIGSARALDGAMLAWCEAINAAGKPVLAVDLPSPGVRATHTLSLLTLKASLYAARDAAGDIWFDDLGVGDTGKAIAQLSGTPASRPRPHGSHKGTFGDVAVIGGAPGMAGAALLAASGALHGGAGRVFVGMLGDALPLDMSQPELMMRAWDSLDLAAITVVCGCGGGDAVRGPLATVLSASRSLVLDADALNAIAADAQLQSLLEARGRRGKPTAITPHPLEAARLLGCATKDVQADRITAAQSLTQRYGCVTVLKGSGTVIAAKDPLPRINPTGNARLATGGTGDVLAGFIAARMGHDGDVAAAVASAVFDHGLAADRWREGRALTASALARRLTP